MSDTQTGVYDTLDQCECPNRSVWHFDAGVQIRTAVSRAIVETLNSRSRLIPCDSPMSTQSGYDAAALWEILAETVHALTMYKHHKRYVEKVLLPEKPHISAKEMGLVMGMPLGEAIVILEELRPSKAPPESKAKAGTGKSLLDYGAQ